ncbi:MAG: insulinase family protein [Rhizobacter sp.]|nr:insulinase family protein [Chlorobiales bacterium]
MSARPTEILDRTQPPSPAASSPARFPDWIEHTLSNGLKVIIYEQRTAATINVRLYIKSGATADGTKLRLAAMTYGLLTRGTTSRDANAIAEEIDFLGADLSAGAGLDNATLSLSALSKHLDKGLDLFEDAALHPTFPEKELEFLRQQSLNRLQLSKSDGGSLAGEAFSREVYQSHPYGNPSLGTEQSLNAITTEDVKRYYRAFAVPNNAFIAVAGDVDAGTIIAKLEARFKAWPQGVVPEIKFDLPKPSEKTQVILVQKDGAVQSAVHVGHLGVPRNHPDYIKIYVTNMLLGGYFGSRLNLNLREQHGYTYGAGSGFSAHLLLGDFSTSAQVRNEVTADAIRETLAELHRITAEPVSKSELEEVKNYIIGTFAIQNETAPAVMNRISLIELYGLPRDYYQTFREKVAALTTNDILETAQKYIHPDRVHIVLSGDAKAIGSSLERFGKVSVQDADGNSVS